MAICTIFLEKTGENSYGTVEFLCYDVKNEIHKSLGPANCPALVRLVMEIATAIQGGSPDSTAVTPKARDTEKYPRQMGNPLRIPSINSFRFKINSPSVIEIL